MVAVQRQEQAEAEAAQRRTLADAEFYAAQKAAEGEAYQMEKLAAAEAQQIALDTIRPGIPASDVDRAVRDYAEEVGVSHMVRHHSGHGKGLEGHEMPFFDQGDDTILRTGMLMSCEPGFYRPGFAGFRHSDTVLVTEDGCDVLTNYPRELEELVIAV